MNRQLKVINVLKDEVYTDAHIKGSMSVPLAELKDFAEHTSKDTPLIVYCASYTCPLSAQAWHMLHELGFENVRAYEGGMNEWYFAGLPTVGAHALDYLKKAISHHGPEDQTIKRVSTEELKAIMEQEKLL